VGSVVLVRSLSIAAPAATAPDPAPFELPDGAVERLAGALRIPTVILEEQVPEAELRELHRHLEESFPRAHQTLSLERVGGLTLLYRWPGSEADFEPLVLLAHQDVVPAEGEAEWTHPPFSGTIAEGFVWGRGALDNKGSLMAILEAVELLLGEGFAPRRSLLLAFGHDEEVGGRQGARRAAALLASRGVRPFMVLDEGSAIVEGILPGLAGPVALVGVAEKGYLSVELVARREGGHSSIPPRDTAAEAVARAVAKVADRPLPARLDGPARGLLETLAPEMPWRHRLVMANLWLFRPLVLRQAEAIPVGNALVRTTTAPTMLEGSAKDNVLPTEARAVVNFRIHPADSPQEVLAHVAAAVAGLGVEVATYGGFSESPSPVSPAEGAAWELLALTLAQVAPGVPMAPSLVPGGTDSRHYARLGGPVYRFTPQPLGPGDLERIHGIDERLAVADFENMVRFYAQLVRNASASTDPAAGEAPRLP
jgi:carboxypeptidase PM20D1